MPCGACSSTIWNASLGSISSFPDPCGGVQSAVDRKIQQRVVFGPEYILRTRRFVSPLHVDDSEDGDFSFRAESVVCESLPVH